MLCSHVCIMCYVCPILEPSLNAKVAFGCKSYSILLRKSWWMNKNDSLAKSSFSLNISGMGWPKKQNSMGFKKCVCLKIDPFSYLQFWRCINCLSSFSPSKRPFLEVIVHYFRTKPFWRHSTKMSSLSRGVSFHDWPAAPTDDQCRAAVQGRVTHLGAARIVATKLGPDPQAARAWRMRHLVLCLCSCGYFGSLEVSARRTGGGSGVFLAWPDTNWRWVG